VSLFIKGSGAEPTAAVSRGKAPCYGAPDVENVLSFRSANEVHIYHFFYPVNCSNILFKRILLQFYLKLLYC